MAIQYNVPEVAYRDKGPCHTGSCRVGIVRIRVQEYITYLRLTQLTDSIPHDHPATFQGIQHILKKTCTLQLQKH
eukprot:1365405-Amorphochlora_amoeboformis.AAC.1